MAVHFCNKTGNILVNMSMRGCSKSIRESILSSGLLSVADSDVRVASAYVRRCDWSCAVLSGIGSGSVVALVRCLSAVFRLTS